MKTNPLLLVTAALSFTLVGTAGCAKKESITVSSPATLQPAAMPVPTATPPAAQPAAATATDNSDVTVAQWSDIKDDTYDQRAHFFAGLKKLEAKVDLQIAELNAKRATLKGTTSTEDWDFAMKAMETARTYLASTGRELTEADPDLWSQKKEKVGQAWTKTQDAYSKVKASTTS